MSTLREMTQRLVEGLTPAERRVLDARFAGAPRGELVHVPLRFKLKPRLKRGRGQRKSRRDRIGRQKHEAHVIVDRLLGNASRFGSVLFPR